MTAPSAFDRFCREAFDFLRASNAPHLVIGGLAVVAVGEPRTTGDVDVIVFVSREGADALIDAALSAGFELSAEAERKRLAETGTLRFCRAPFHIDLITASLPFEDEALRRSTEQTLFGKRVRFPTPEDLILFKVIAGRDKDLLDAAGILRRHGDKLDRAYVEATLRGLCDLAEDMAAFRRWEDLLRRV